MEPRRGGLRRPGVRWLAAGTWAGGILVFSLLRVPPGAELLGDKVLHALAYAGLAVLLRVALAASGQTGSTGASIGIAFVYGAAVEGLQGWLPWRAGEWLDLVANGVGSLAALIPPPKGWTGQSMGLWARPGGGRSASSGVKE